MLTAMQVFVKEVVGSNFSEVTAGPFSFISEQAGPFSIVVVGTKSKEASEKAKYLVLRFIRKYKTMIENWRGELINFVDFDEDVHEVFGMTEGVRVDPKNPLDALALLQIEERLQSVAKRILAKYELSIEEMAKDLDLTFIDTANLLNELFDLGYIGRFRRDDKTFYFIG